MPDSPNELEGNKTTPKREFGRIQSSIDSRDWKLDDFIPPKLTLDIPKNKSWDFPLDAPLDQESTAHCVGFGGAHFGINLPVFTLYTKEEAHDLYYKCKVIDGDPTGENGTTLRSLARVFQDVGAINHYAFAGDLDSIRTWVLTRGPVIMGTIWTEGMMSPDEQGVLSIEGFILGGHCFIVNEWDIKEGYITILNSWGENWGIDGRAYISIKDFESIFLYGGEALAAVELENYKTKNEDWFANLINNLLELFKKIFSC